VYDSDGHLVQWAHGDVVREADGTIDLGIDYDLYGLEYDVADQISADTYCSTSEYNADYRRTWVGEDMLQSWTWYTDCTWTTPTRRNEYFWEDGRLVGHAGDGNADGVPERVDEYTYGEDGEIVEMTVSGGAQRGTYVVAESCCVERCVDE
jgi:hypothetical protein